MNNWTFDIGKTHMLTGSFMILSASATINANAMQNVSNVLQAVYMNMSSSFYSPVTIYGTTTDYQPAAPLPNAYVVRKNTPYWRCESLFEAEQLETIMARMTKPQSIYTHRSTKTVKYYIEDFWFRNGEQKLWGFKLPPEAGKWAGVIFREQDVECIYDPKK